MKTLMKTMLKNGYRVVCDSSMSHADIVNTATKQKGEEEVGRMRVEFILHCREV
jgi:hypothetical protein